MVDPRVVSVADVLIRYSTRIQPGDLVAISGSTEAIPLIQAVYQKVLEAGGHPHVIAELPGLPELFFEFAGEEQLTFVSPLERLVLSEFDASISIGELFQKDGQFAVP